MRTLIIASGFIVLVGCIAYSLVSNENQNGSLFIPINLGYFIVIAGAFISVALFRDVKEDDSRTRYEIYRILATESKSIDEVTELATRELKFHGGSFTIKSNIASMLDEGLLIIEDGKIKLG